MDKPITVAQDELATKIVEAINDSQLHVSLVYPVISDIYNSVNKLLLETKAKEKEEYEKQLKES